MNIDKCRIECQQQLSTQHFKPGVVGSSPARGSLR